MWVVAGIALVAALAIAFCTPSGGRQPLRDASLTVLMLISIGAAGLALLIGGALGTMAPPPAPKAPDIEEPAPLRP